MKKQQKRVPKSVRSEMSRQLLAQIVKFGTYVYGAQRMNPKCYIDPHTFHLAPSANQSFHQWNISTSTRWIGTKCRRHSWFPDDVSEWWTRFLEPTWGRGFRDISTTIRWNDVWYRHVHLKCILIPLMIDFYVICTQIVVVDSCRTWAQWHCREAGCF